MQIYLPPIDGFFLKPSTVPGRSDVTGLVISSANEDGKMEWSTLDLDNLSDVQFTLPLSAGECLCYDGSNWYI